MRFPSRSLIALTLGSLTACGGGDGGGGSPAPAPPAPAPAKLALSAGNYQDAAGLAMGTANSAYAHARMGVQLVDNLINVTFPSFFPTSCPEGGLTSLELTDQNKDRSLDPGDTVHLRWDACKVQGTTSTGVMRVELNEATQTATGREYRLSVFIDDLELTASSAAAPPVTIDFSATVRFTRTSTSNHTVVETAEFRSGQIAGDTGTSELFIDYLQDYATQTYRYAIRGVASSGNLGGEVDFTTPEDFTGVVGEYPSAGRLTVTGNANSSVRLAEEGAAAGNTALVLAAVDTNGDGAADASDEAVAWASVVPVQLFLAFSDQAFPGQLLGIAVPMP